MSNYIRVHDLHTQRPILVDKNMVNVVKETESPGDWNQATGQRDPTKVGSRIHYGDRDAYVVVGETVDQIALLLDPPFPDPFAQRLVANFERASEAGSRPPSDAEIAAAQRVHGSFGDDGL